jgi:hypothetical protein
MAEEQGNAPVSHAPRSCLPVGSRWDLVLQDEDPFPRD